MIYTLNALTDEIKNYDTLGRLFPSSFFAEEIYLSMFQAYM